MLSVSLLCLVHQPGGMKHDISFSVLLLSYVAPHSTPFLIAKQPQQLLTPGPGMCTRRGQAGEKKGVALSVPLCTQHQASQDEGRESWLRKIPSRFSLCWAVLWPGVVLLCIQRDPKCKTDLWACTLGCQGAVTFNVKSRWQPTQSPIQWACMPFIPYHSGRSAKASCMACGNKQRSEKQQCKSHVRTSGVGLEVGKVETRKKVLDIRLPHSRASVGVAKDNRGAQFSNHLIGLTYLCPRFKVSWKKES